MREKKRSSRDMEVPHEACRHFCYRNATVSARLACCSFGREISAEVPEMPCSFVGGLSGLHTYFTSRNKSTYEHFRSRAGSQENPYNVNCARNWQQVCSACPQCMAPQALQTVRALCRTLHSPVTPWQPPLDEAIAACAGLLHTDPASVSGDTPVHPQSAPSCFAACYSTRRLRADSCLLAPPSIRQEGYQLGDRVLSAWLPRT